MIPLDTSPDAFREHALMFRRLGGPRRLEVMLEMCDYARELTASGIRRRHPEFDENDVRREVARLVNEVAPALR